MYKTGYILRLKKSFLNEKVGTLAYVYSHNADYNQFRLITENGVNLGLFTKDYFSYFEYIEDSGVIYNFKDYETFQADMSQGWLTNVFA